MTDLSRAERTLRYRSTVCGFGVLLLWGLSRFGGWLEGALLSGCSPAGGAVLSLCIYCIMMGLPLLLLCHLLEMPRHALLPLCRSVPGAPLFLPVLLGALVVLNLLGWELTDLLGRWFAVPAYAPVMGDAPAEIAVNLIASTLFPAVLEELFFRGAILHGLMEAGAGTAVTVSAVLFMVSHGSVAQWVPALGAGLLFGWLAVRTGSLRQGILTHFCYNLFAALATLLPGALTRTILPALFVGSGLFCLILFSVQGRLRCGAKASALCRGRVVWTLPLLLSMLIPAVFVLSLLTPLQ